MERAVEKCYSRQVTALKSMHNVVKAEVCGGGTADLTDYIEYPSAAVLNLWGATPWGVATCLQGGREGGPFLKVSYTGISEISLHCVTEWCGGSNSKSLLPIQVHCLGMQ